MVVNISISFTFEKSLTGVILQSSSILENNFLGRRKGKTTILFLYGISKISGSPAVEVNKVYFRGIPFSN